MEPAPGAMRWLGAILGLVVVALLSLLLLRDALGDLLAVAPPQQRDPGAAEVDAGPPPESPAGPAAGGPVQDGSVTPLTDLAVAGGVVSQTDAERLQLDGPTGAGSLHLQFATIPGNPGCIAGVDLELTVVEATPAELAAYPSGLADLQGLAPGEAVPQALPTDQRPGALAFTDGTPGRLRWNITDLYAGWVRGELAPTGTPGAGGAQQGPGLVVAIASTVADATTTVTFASAETGQPTAPELVWTGTPGCGV
ncbi:MAG TPA: hypothetical protein VG452_03135 [Egibacteraceae bacterium]|nr:hypothetical protein [Egibacteraceae bacterium]